MDPDYILKPYHDSDIPWDRKSVLSPMFTAANPILSAWQDPRDNEAHQRSVNHSSQNKPRTCFTRSENRTFVFERRARAKDENKNASWLVKLEMRRRTMTSRKGVKLLRGVASSWHVFQLNGLKREKLREQITNLIRTLTLKILEKEVKNLACKSTFNRWVHCLRRNTVRPRSKQLLGTRRPQSISCITCAPSLSYQSEEENARREIYILKNYPFRAVWRGGIQKENSEDEAHQLLTIRRMNIDQVLESKRMFLPVSGIYCKVSPLSKQNAHFRAINYFAVSLAGLSAQSMFQMPARMAGGVR
uniref:Uncharacterized protein n=1 Tax=Steinernema glaseri TaxID=37863 RepID=A0A1I7ZCB5_9BILA